MDWLNLSPAQRETYNNLRETSLKGLMVSGQMHNNDLLMVQVSENFSTPWRFFGSIDKQGIFQGVD